MTNLERFKNGEVAIKTTIDDYLQLAFIFYKENLKWGFSGATDNSPLKYIPERLNVTDYYIVYHSGWGIGGIEEGSIKSNPKLIDGSLLSLLMI